MVVYRAGRWVLLPEGLLRCVVSSQKRWLSGRCEALFGPRGPGVARVLPMPLTSVGRTGCVCVGLSRLERGELVIVERWMEWLGDWRCCVHTAYRPPGEPARYTNRGNAPSRLPQRWCGNAWLHAFVAAWWPRLHWAAVPMMARNQKGKTHRERAVIFGITMGMGYAHEGINGCKNRGCTAPANQRHAFVAAWWPRLHWAAVPMMATNQKEGSKGQAPKRAISDEWYNHRVARGYVPFVVAVSLRPSFCLWPGTEEKERRKEGRPKDRLESGVGLWLWPALPASGYRKPEKEDAQKVMLQRREPEGHHGVMDAVPLIRALLPRGRLKNSREVQRPNVWKGIHLRGSSLRSFFVWPWTPPRNFMRHIGVRGASRHDRRVRCAFGAIYDRHLEKHPHIWTLGVARICWWRRWGHSGCLANVSPT